MAMDLRPGAVNYTKRGDPTIIAAPRDPLLTEREKTHGPFISVADTAQSIKRIYHGLGGEKATNYYQLPRSQREALDMIATKISRILHGNGKEKDHWDDIAGYAKLGSEACE